MSNQALRFNSEPSFWMDNDKEKKGGMTIGKVLDKFTKLQGVACDGVINGLMLGTTKVRLSLETINSVDSIAVRDCSGTLLMQLASNIDPQATSAVYRATLTGSNGAIAAPSVGKNTFSAAIVWAYSAEGVYTGTLAGAFPTAARTNLQVSLGSATGGLILKLVWTSTDVVTLSTFAVDGTTPADFIGDIDVNITVDPA